MQDNRSVLGKGLSALIPNAGNTRKQYWGPTVQTVPDAEQIVQVPVASVVANPQQPRKHFDDERLGELAASIKEYGIIQPLIATKLDGGTYQLIAGERRLRAAQRIGLETVPIVVRKMEEQKKLEVSLIENVQRHDLNPLEEAVSYKRLMDEFSLTQEEVARRVGKSRPSIANFVRLLALPKPVLEAIENESITFSHAKLILSFETAEEQLKELKRIQKGGLTVAQTAETGKKGSFTVRAESDPVLASWEQKITAKLGFAARIKKRRRGGIIEVPYSSDEDLKSILDTLLGE